jgi:ubiquitin C-terminal hydrolase
MGQLRDRIECQACTHVTIKYDMFMTLSLSIPQLANNEPTGIYHCLRKFAQSEIIENRVIN